LKHGSSERSFDVNALLNFAARGGTVHQPDAQMTTTGSVVHARWDLRTGYGTILRDTSGNRNHAVAHNPLWRTYIAASDSKTTGLSVETGRSPKPTEAAADDSPTARKPTVLRGRLRARAPIGAAALHSPRTEAITREGRGLADDKSTMINSGSCDRSVAEVDDAEPTLPRKAVDLFPTSRYSASRWSNNPFEDCVKRSDIDEVVLPVWPVEGWKSGKIGPQHLTVEFSQVSVVFHVTVVFPLFVSATYELWVYRGAVGQLKPVVDPLDGTSLEGCGICAKVLQLSRNSAPVVEVSLPTPLHNVRTMRLFCTESSAPVAVESLKIFGMPERNFVSRKRSMMALAVHPAASFSTACESAPALLSTPSLAGVLGDIGESQRIRDARAVVLERSAQGEHSSGSRSPGRSPTESALLASPRDTRIASSASPRAAAGETPGERSVRLLFYSIDVDRTGFIPIDDFVTLYRKLDVIGLATDSWIQSELRALGCTDKVNYQQFCLGLTRLSRM